MLVLFGGSLLDAFLVNLAKKAASFFTFSAYNEEGNLPKFVKT